MNPYTNQSFFSFFFTLISRMVSFATGKIPLDALVSDEIQLLVLISVSIACALVGTFLVLRKMTMLANALSHTILLGIVLAFVILGRDSFDAPLGISSMLISAALMGWLTTFLTSLLTYVFKVQKDASIGLVFTTCFALGIVFVTTLTKNVHIGTEVVMGNVDALQPDDLKLTLAILAISVSVVLLFYKGLKITTFDPQFALLLGFYTGGYTLLLMTLTAATCVGAFRSVGVLMVLSLLTGPPLTARLITHHLKWMIVLSCCLGALASILAVALSRGLLSTFGTPYSTAGIAVIVVFLQFLFVLGLKQFTPIFASGRMRI